MKHSKSFKLLLLIALTLMFVCSSWAQSTAVRRIGVLTPGGDFAPVLEGLRQGLAQLGYLEGKQITLIVEDTKMETLDPVKAAFDICCLVRWSCMMRCQKISPGCCGCCHGPMCICKMKWSLLDIRR